MTDAMAELAVFELLSLECRVNSYGATTYHNSSGQLHRVYGPAVESANGALAWYQNGLSHRLDGPAIEYSDGFRAWYQNGRLHRLDGPAIERPDGSKSWYINDKELTEAGWQRVVASMETV